MIHKLIHVYDILYVSYGFGPNIFIDLSLIFILIGLILLLFFTITGVYQLIRKQINIKDELLGMITGLIISLSIPIVIIALNLLFNNPLKKAYRVVDASEKKDLPALLKELKSGNKYASKVIFELSLSDYAIRTEVVKYVKESLPFKFEDKIQWYKKNYYLGLA